MNNEDFDPDIVEAKRIGRCADCSRELNVGERPGSAFCSELCKIRWRDRRRYHANVEASRARSRDYHRRNRDKVLARSQAKRDALRGPRPELRCSECGDELTGRRRVICGKASCRDRRFKRTNPESYAARERRKVERRKAARRERRKDAAP